MDLVFEMTNTALVQMLNERLRRERLILPIITSAGADTFVFHDMSVGSIAPFRAENSDEMIQVAGTYVAGAPPVRWISVPQIRATAQMSLRFARLSELETLALSAAAHPIPFNLPITLWLTVRPEAGRVRLSLAVTDIDLTTVRNILIESRTAGATFTPDALTALLRQVDEEIAALRSQAFAVLRSSSAGSFSTVIDLSPLRATLGTTADLRAYNAGVAVLSRPALPPGSTSPPPPPNLAIAVQVESPRWFVTDALAAATLSNTIWDAWNDFYHTRAAATAAGEDWSLELSGELLATAVNNQLTNNLHSDPGGEVERTSPVTTSWRLAVAPQFPNGFVQAETQINLTRLDVDAALHVQTQFLPGDGGRIRIRSDFGWDLNWSEVARWGALAGLGAGGIGALAGGLAGPFGALAGFVIGFAIGFSATFIAAAVITPTLPSMAHCTQTDRTLECLEDFPDGLGDLISGIRLRRVSGGGPGGIFLAGNAAAAVMRPALPGVVIWSPLQWRRTGPYGALAWSAVLEFDIHNQGQRPMLVGPVQFFGDGAALYQGRAMGPGGPVREGDSVRWRIVVPRADFEAARATGNLHPPRFVFFTNAGCRVLETAGIPAPISDQQITDAEAIETAADRLHGMHREAGIFDQIIAEFPEGAYSGEWYRLTQVAARGLPRSDQLVLARLDRNAVVAASRQAASDEVSISAFVAGPAPRLAVLRMPAGLTAKELDAAVAAKLQNLPPAIQVRDVWKTALGDAVADSGAPGEAVFSLRGWFSVAIDRVKPGAAKAALDAMIQAGYQDGDFDLASQVIAAARSIDMPLPPAAKLGRAFDSVTGKGLLAIDTPYAHYELNVDGLAVPVLTAAGPPVAQQPSDKQPAPSLDGVVQVGRSVAVKAAVLDADGKAPDILVVLRLVDEDPARAGGAAAQAKAAEGGQH